MNNMRALVTNAIESVRGWGLGSLLLGGHSFAIDYAVNYRKFLVNSTQGITCVVVAILRKSGFDLKINSSYLRKYSIGSSSPRINGIHVSPGGAGTNSCYWRAMSNVRRFTS